ncbi:AAA family ATPase [uncultured Amphritea sp.]|uniref:ATP-dependent DNA helicase n=3 Tax=Pseudomonadota TaxID=1224 RepID=UPI00261717CF|nr:AAA family ATPase [uncultured Amphritea sp.]
MSTPTPQLNADQQKAADTLATYIIGPDKEFFLTGSPGVGKTYLTRELVSLLPSTINAYNQSMSLQRTPMELMLTATTNKAAAVLGEQTGRQAKTIHSFLGVVPMTDYSTGQTYLKRTNNYKIHSNVMLFIDEASMIDKDLYMILQEATDETCKIIYVGDKNQLPPVMEKLSPAVALADIGNRHYEITTPVRNAGSPALQKLCEGLKEDILLERPKDQLTKWKQAPGEIDFINGDQLKLLIEGIYGPNGTMKADDPELACRILCYTNKAVIGYNQFIRGIRGLPDYPTVGERMVCNSHFPLSAQASFNVEEQVKIHGIYGPEEVQIDDHNSLDAYMLEVSSAFTSRYTVKYPADRDAWDSLRRHYKSKNFRNWKLFYKLQEEWIDLRNREASTVYKAQGSTYDSVILIMDDIFTSRDVNQLRRMLYVGASRARKRIYVYDRGIHQNQRGLYIP